MFYYHFTRRTGSGPKRNLLRRGRGWTHAPRADVRTHNGVRAVDRTRARRRRSKRKKKRLRGNVARRICCSLRTANLSKNSPGLRATYTNIIYILYFVYIINVGRKSIASVSVSRVIIIIRDRSPCRDNRGDASSSRDDNNVLHVRVAAWPGRAPSVGPRRPTEIRRRGGSGFFQRFYFFSSPNPSCWSTRTTRITILSERQTEICYFRLSCGKRIYIYIGIIQEK